MVVEWQKKSGQISALGRKQLEAWEKLADTWIAIPTWRQERTSGTSDISEQQLHLTCHKCGTTIFAASELSITPEIFKASTVAHLRNVHRELDPDA